MIPSGPRGATPWPGRLVVGVPYAWLAIFFALPILIIVRISLSEPVLGTPPYSPLLTFPPERGMAVAARLDNYALVLGDPLYLDAVLVSLRTALVSTIACLLIGYPMAYAIARARASARNVLLVLVVLPFWTSFLIRIYAWMGILNSNGLINNALLGLGVIDQPLALLHTEFAVHLGIVYAYLPFMVLPLYSILERLDPRLLEAAADLGAPPWRAFLSVTLPLSLPGIVAGSLLVFIPAVGEFVIPELLGGGGSNMLGRALWTEFFANRDWPLASALAVVILVLVVAPFMAMRRYVERGQAAAR
jgi:putrescine transport system permease protein